MRPAQAPPAPNQPTVGPATRPDWAAHALPLSQESHVQQALNAIGLGNPVPNLYDAYKSAKQGNTTAALASLAGAVPLIPEGEGARMVEGFMPAAESIAREGAPEAQQLLKWRQDRLPEFAPPAAAVRPDVAPQNLGMGVARDIDPSQFSRKPPAPAALMRPKPDLRGTGQPIDYEKLRKGLYDL